ncbi:MAG: cytidine deaminase [Chitinophagales bacterium]|nr:cytidine deaminase [Chitinophagales bacterium]
MIQDKEFHFSFREIDDITELPHALQELLVQSKNAVSNAYAPYSGFKVGASVLLENGTIVSGGNQENASYPVGLCAERVTLSAASALHSNNAVVALAVTACGINSHIDKPVAPCGICRQTILEYEERFNRNIEIILQGESGKIYWIFSVKDLLPLYFGNNDLTNTNHS